MNTRRALDLAEEFFRLARHRMPMDWLRSDLTMPQLKVLLALYLDGPQSCGALAATQGLSLPTMTGILTRSERRGYLQRQRDPGDGRRVISGLSPLGRELVDHLWAAGREELGDVFARIPTSDLRTVERALEVLIDALAARPAGERLAPAHERA
ncbi:MAG TPA: MarR family transcriptional regulator [Dehalococcoidia bacterium]|nr:MarR family transcriptional regulator [Dehalococcoidia bacterium]